MDIENNKTKTDENGQTESIQVDSQAEPKTVEKKAKKTKTIIGLMVFILVGLILIVWAMGFGSSPKKNTITVKDKNAVMPGFSVENASQTLVNDAGQANSSNSAILPTNNGGLSNSNSNPVQMQGVVPPPSLKNNQTDPIFGKATNNNTNIPVTQLVVSPDSMNKQEAVKGANTTTASNSSNHSSPNPLFSSESSSKSTSPSRSQTTANNSGSQPTQSEPILIESSPARQGSYFLFGKTDEGKTNQNNHSPNNENNGQSRVISGLPNTKAVDPIKKPPFGTLLPLQTMGAISTLGTTPLVRMVLTRNMSGQGWQLPRGTVFVGRASGGSGNRAFVEVLGFLDNNRNAFIKVGGDLQGIDGATGLLGESKKVGSVWKSVFREVADKAYQTANTWISRNSSGTNIALPNPSENLGANNTESIRYVVVKPNSFGYLFINDLPKTLNAESADLPPVADLSGKELNPPDSKQYMNDEEMLSLISNGSNDQIRKAMPRIRPEYRETIEAILKQPEQK